MWFPSLSKKWSFQWQHFQVGRKRKKSISNGFNIEKVVFRFQAPLSTDGSLPRLDNIMCPTDKGQWERGEQLHDKGFTYKIKHKIVDTEEYVCHKDHRKCDLKGSSYNDLCQYDCFLSSLSFHTWHQLVRSKLGWFENIGGKKSFVNVVPNTNQMVLFLPAQNLKLWKRTLLPPSAFSQNQSEGMWLVGN